MTEKLKPLFLFILVFLMMGGFVPLILIYGYFYPPRQFKSAWEECHYFYKGSEATKCVQDKRRIERMTDEELDAAYQGYLDDRCDEHYSRR